MDPTVLQYYKKKETPFFNPDKIPTSKRYRLRDKKNKKSFRFFLISGYDDDVDCNSMSILRKGALYKKTVLTGGRRMRK